MHLRAATADDQATLFGLHRAVFQAHIAQLWGWDESWQRTHFATEWAACPPLVIEADGRTAGYLQLHEEPQRLYVQNLAIAAAFQGQGLGTRLLQGIQHRAAAQRLPVQLGVFRTNPAARRLYERLGFVATGSNASHIHMAWTAPPGT